MYTGSDVFDSVRFRGVRLWRDMQMLPNSKQNFTPVVRGVAQSNALVTIEQNGFVVYQKEVPPGPFAIDDLQLAGGGADSWKLPLKKLTVRCRVIVYLIHLCQICCNRAFRNMNLLPDVVVLREPANSQILFREAISMALIIC